MKQKLIKCKMCDYEAFPCAEYDEETGECNTGGDKGTMISVFLNGGYGQDVNGQVVTNFQFYCCPSCMILFGHEAAKQ